MSVGHWLYVIGVIVVLITMATRRTVIVPCLIFSFLIALSFKGSVVFAVQTLFNGMKVATVELYDIFLIITVMVAMLRSLRSTGADNMMISPLKSLMVSPLVSYIVLSVATIVIALFFWPTPSVPLVGGLLAPAAIAAGLPPKTAAVAIALAGQGMALAGDVIIQGAPKLTATAAGVPVQLVLWKAGLLTTVAGVVALPLAYFGSRKEIAEFAAARAAGKEVVQDQSGKKLLEEPVTVEKPGVAAFLSKFAPVVMALALLAMIFMRILGGDATALLGGSGAVVLLVASLMTHGGQGFDEIADRLGEGFTFAFKVMGPIVPIAGFFFLGNPETSAKIMGQGAPGYLFDVGKILSQYIPAKGLLAGFGMLVIGMITGLDGSGFSGLPLTGSLAGSLAAGDAAVASTLGAIGQIGAVWSGGGTLVAWSTLVAVAGICGVPVMEVLRRNVVPVIAGLIVSTLVGVILL